MVAQGEEVHRREHRKIYRLALIPADIMKEETHLVKFPVSDHIVLSWTTPLTSSHLREPNHSCPENGKRHWPTTGWQMARGYVADSKRQMAPHQVKSVHVGRGGMWEGSKGKTQISSGSTIVVNQERTWLNSLSQITLSLSELSQTAGQHW